MEYKIREIHEKDNKEIENIIRSCLIEFGVNHEGTAWAAPNLGKFSEIYNKEGNKCWVAIEYAKNYYSRFYLETLVKKEHFACDIRYI